MEQPVLERPESERPWWQRSSVRIASSKPGAAFFRKVMHRIDRPLLRLTGGRISFASAYPVLLLTTTGAKTGKERTVPLLYVQREAGEIAIIGTRFGSTKHPGWAHNLRKLPEATVEIRGQRGPYRARDADDAEREEAWERAVRMYSGYARYEPRARRRIPIFILMPVEGAEG
jgi:F420H(2)-dependent quinone reductase